jgi:hypothetical protein
MVLMMFSLRPVVPDSYLVKDKVYYKSFKCDLLRYLAKVSAYNQSNAVSTIGKKGSLRTEKQQNKQFRVMSATSDVLKIETEAVECRVARML